MPRPIHLVLCKLTDHCLHVIKGLQKGNTEPYQVQPANMENPVRASRDLEKTRRYLELQWSRLLGKCQRKERSNWVLY